MACGLASGYILLSEIYDATAQSVERAEWSIAVGPLLWKQMESVETMETVENARVFSSI